MTNGTTSYLWEHEAEVAPRLKSLPWRRLAVEALLALGFVLGASSLLIVR